MRLILRFTIPVEKGNEAAADGSMAVAIDSMTKHALTSLRNAKPIFYGPEGGESNA